ncbi:unnamed protein product [Protopolystoma xenopodis]|uniref:Uncharacterized protein n=1 Tax=Protopolystoma xenopodis TaxID=117903 RepID=A0A448WPQ4_9PLAT|nr:unnamed protein product [Protopolystoma xenopodis]
MLGLYWRIHEMDLFSNLYLFVIISGISAYLIGLSYGNSKAPLMEKIAAKRADAITKIINKEVGSDKKISRRDRDDM